MAIKDWNGFKKSGDTYIPNDATARAGVTATVDLMKDTVGWIGGNLFNKDATPNNTQGAVQAIPTATGVNIKSTESGSWAIARYWIKVTPNTKYYFLTNVSVASGESTIYIQGSTLDNPTAYGDFTASLLDERNTGAISRTFSTGSCKWIQVGLFATRNTEGSLTGDVTYSDLMILTEEQYVFNPVYRPYHESVEDYAFPRSEQAMLGAVNLLNNTATSDTIQGIVTTVNADKSVSIAAGTVTGGNYVCTLTLNAGIPAGKRVFLSGCPKGGSTNTYMLAYQNASDQWINAQYDVGNGTWIEDGVKRVAISIINGVTVSAMTFKPMISLSDKTPYTPFAMTNMELTEKVMMILTPKPLPNNADLNNYLNEGDYICDANTNTYTNIPSAINNTSFRLKILPFNASASRCIQILYVNKAEPEVYMRTNFNGTWQSWYKFTGTVVS